MLKDRRVSGSCLSDEKNTYPPGPARLLRYMAASAFFSSVRPCSPSNGYRLIPSLAVM